MKINKKRLAIGIIFLSILFSGKNFILFNVTPSLPRGVYLLLPAKNIKRGDTVVFDVPEELRKYEYIPKYTKLLLKNVGALANDKVSIKDDMLYINDSSYGKIYVKDGQGTILPKLNENELQPKNNEFLPLAPHQNSFDGRYYGTIKLDKVKNKAKLILQI